MPKPKSLSLKHTSKLSKANLLLFALIFAAIGGYAIFRIFAAIPNPNLLGDINNDNIVNATDLTTLLANFNSAYPPADINNNGIVDIFDLATLITHYGQSYTGGGSGTYVPKYYVSPSGNDSNNGTSASTPWKTIGKVSNKCLQAGDVVAFQGGQTFSDSYLTAACSGTSANPIVITSYGTGQAKIINHVWMGCGIHDIKYDNLELTQPGTTEILFAAGGSCASNPVNNITLQNSYLHDTNGEGLQCNDNDSNWLINNNNFQNTGDSGLITFLCPNITITHNTIAHTGINTAISYGKHGIYSKSIGSTIAYNDFSDNRDGQSVSIRTHGQYVYGNTIHDTDNAVAFFDFDATPQPQGASYVYDNRMWNISGFGFYTDGAWSDPHTGQNLGVSGLDLVWANNTFLGGGGEALNLSDSSSSEHMWVINNIFAGTISSAYHGCATCTESNNDWFGATSNTPSGAADLHINPNLSAAPALALPAGSSLIDKGTLSVPNLTYSLSSDGAPLHYKGSAPDMGAVELQ